MKYHLRLTGGQHDALRSHLFPGDGNEAVAVALCGRRAGDGRHVFTARSLHPIAYDDCAVRSPVRVTWSTELLPPLLAEAAKRGQAVVKIHSHPGGLEKFSRQDDRADRELFEAVDTWLDDGLPHAS